MADERLRISVSEDYATALGRAAYVFSWTEWAAVWCCERMDAGFVEKAKTLTAGQIADRLVHLMGKRPANAAEWQRCVDAAAEFKRITKRRNDIVHANPGTAPDGAQNLFRHGSQWTAASVGDLADEFAKCGMELNDIFHNVAL